ncbi:MAG: radical SAM protein [Candidatus Lokiarchaeota archaeon]|nr:radical SAM protein [Candidatus Lokiarchaeota archaeon]
MLKYSSLPRNVTLHLTENCNLRCKMCYFWGETGTSSNESSGKKPAVMDFELVKKIILELRSVTPFYSLFGGEPLTYPYLEELIIRIKNAGSIVDTPTNGTLLAKNASMLVRTGFDSIRVSLDGPQETNDLQRGAGSYAKAIKGIETLHNEKEKAGKKKPTISLIYTITNDNYDSIEKLFLDDIDLNKIDWVTIQMQNFLTESMGKSYAKFLKSEFGINSNNYWKAMVRSPGDFANIDTEELSHQVKSVIVKLDSMHKNYLLLPPTFSAGNIKAYLAAKWEEMTDIYKSCLSPWTSIDITASGDIAPCHIFYDLILGNLSKNSISDIWNGDKFQIFRNYFNQNSLLPVCSGCCILYLSGKKFRKLAKSNM